MNERNSNSVNTVFILIVFSLFAVSSLFLVLIGANVYKGIVTDMDANNKMRASLSYVANKVHAAGTNAVELQTVDGQKALVLSSDMNGNAYKTYIYEYNGNLMELLTRAENGFQVGAGDKITPVSDFSMTESSNELTLSVNGKGNRRLTMNLCLTEGGGTQ